MAAILGKKLGMTQGRALPEPEVLQPTLDAALPEYVARPKGALKGHFTPDYFGPIDYAALYWHIVDLIWIFLFPLLYLIH